MTRLTFCAFTVMVIASMAACRPDETVASLGSIPFTANADGLMIVPAVLGGSRSVHVILDTGAGLDVFAPSLVAELHGKPAGLFSAFRMTGERLDIPLFVVSELSIGPMVKKDVVVGTWEVLEQFHRDGAIDGVISVNNFRQQPFTVDFIERVVVFESPQSLVRRRALGESSPLLVHDQRGIALDLFAHFLVGSHPGQCEIDTGSPRGTISTRYFGPLGITAGDRGSRQPDVGGSAARGQTHFETTLPQIALAAAPRVTLGQARVSFSDIIYDCVVGVDFWSGKVVTVDIAGLQLIVASVPYHSGTPPGGRR